ncbi:MAG: FtsX-like permease family protein [Erysipelotrichaceae bacterium]|jgi:ABC-type antimicrobial peptide transport system permease subunit|nr:FtsX-like permease family protein [Erysipelotrichaceae bacterium]
MVKRKRLTSFFLRLAGRSNAKDWAGALAVVAIGGIAITLFCGFLANSASLAHRVEALVAESNAADVYVTTTPAGGFNRKEADEIVSHVDGIKGVESRFYTYCSLSSRNALAVVEPNLPIYSRPYEFVKTDPSQTDDHFFIIDHSLLSEDKTDPNALQVGGEAVVSFDLSAFSLGSDTADKLDYFLKAGAENPFKKDNLEVSFKVTAAMKHIENAAKGTFNPQAFLCSNSYFRDSLRDALSKSFTNLGIELIWKLGFQEKIGWGDGDPYGATANFPAANQFLLRLSDPAKASETKTKIQEYYAGKKVNNLYLCQTMNELPSMSALITEMTQAKQLTFVFPVVFFAVALLIIVISVRQMVLKERMDIGTFKALGVKPGEIHRHYALKTGLLVGLGVLIGEIVGPILVPSILGAKYSILYSIPPRVYVFPALHCLLAAAVFIGVALLTTFVVSRKEIKKKPVDSMRSEPPSTKAKPSLKVGRANLMGLSLTMAGRDIRADITKTLMVVIGVMGCTALLCCGFGIEDTITYGVNTDPLIVSGADVTLFLSEEVTKDALATELDLKDEQGKPLVEGYQPYLRKNGNVVCENEDYYTVIHFYGGYESASKNVATHFKFDFPKDKVLVSQKVASYLGAKKGSIIQFLVADKTVKAEVADLVPVFYDNGVYVHADAPFLEGKVTRYNAAWVDAVKDNFQALVDKTKDLDNVAVCDSEASMKKRIQDVMSSVLTMTNAIKVFAFLLAGVVLYDLGLLNFKEKQREIATMKVLGFKDMEIMASLLIQVLTLCLVGIGLGLALGFPFTKLVLYINQVELVDFLYTVFPASYGIAFGFTFILSVAINMLLTLRIRKIKAVESLKSVE